MEELNGKQLLAEVAEEEIKAELMTKLRQLDKEDISARLALEVKV